MRNFVYSTLIFLVLFLSTSSEAKRKGRHRRKYSGPPPPHPVLLWAHALNSSDREQKKIAAFKMSQYSQTIYQDYAINSLITCMNDSGTDMLALQTRVLCTKAMGHAGTASQSEWIRSVLLGHYQNERVLLGNTIVRVMVIRKDVSERVQEAFLETVKKSEDSDELITLMNYFEMFGSGNDNFVDRLVAAYHKTENIKVKRSIAKALAERAQGQKPAIALLFQCADSKDTPLSLTCIEGLQQARKDPSVWTIVAKTIESDDPDVLWETLKLVLSLPETSQPQISKRLLEIIIEKDDSDLVERAILALAVCGDKSDEIFSILTGRLKDTEANDSVRIAAALVLPRQADLTLDKSKNALSNCISKELSQSLKTACQLALDEVTKMEKRLQQTAPIAKEIKVDPPKTDDKSIVEVSEKASSEKVEAPQREISNEPPGGDALNPVEIPKEKDVSIGVPTK